MAVAIGTLDSKRWWLTEQMPERRAESRAQTSLPAALGTPDGRGLPVMVLDLSTEGALLEAAEAPDVDAAYQLCFNFFGRRYLTDLTVMRFSERAGRYLWGCRMNLSLEGARQLRLAVRAALSQPAAA